MSSLPDPLVMGLHSKIQNLRPLGLLRLGGAYEGTLAGQSTLHRQKRHYRDAGGPQEIEGLSIHLTSERWKSSTMEDALSTPYAIPRYSVGLIREGTISIQEYPTISCSKEFADVFGTMFEQYDREHFSIACIDAKHKIIGFHTIAVGTLTTALVHPREVFKTAILLSSASCALFHNHPSGDPTPSREDRELTKRLEQAGELLGIHVLDHIIFGANNRYYSFADEGFITGKAAS